MQAAAKTKQWTGQVLIVEIRWEIQTNRQRGTRGGWNGCTFAHDRWVAARVAEAL